MKKAQYKNAKETKKKISSAYLELLVKGETKFSVTDLVNLAGVNRGTFYLHFKNLEDVAHYIEDEFAENFKIIEYEFRQFDIKDNPRVIIDKVNEIIQKDFDYYKLLIIANENFGLFNKIKSSILNIISNNFVVMKYVNNYDRFKVVVEYIVGGILTCYIEWFKEHIRCTVEELSETLTSLIANGLKGVVQE